MTPDETNAMIAAALAENVQASCGHWPLREYAETGICPTCGTYVTIVGTYGKN
jgi:hypothetical protein